VGLIAARAPSECASAIWLPSTTPSCARGFEQSLIGLGFSGIAAEMVTMAPGDVAKLVAPMGLNPPEGDILDPAVISS
jgi:hypothetical protein